MVEIMLSIKKEIKDLANNAVLLAERELGSQKGKEKKQMAVDYIIRNINIPTPFKFLISIFLSNFIDSVIEASVRYMKSLQETEGD